MGDAVDPHILNLLLTASSDRAISSEEAVKARTDKVLKELRLIARRSDPSTPNFMMKKRASLTELAHREARREIRRRALEKKLGLSGLDLAWHLSVERVLRAKVSQADGSRMERDERRARERARLEAHASVQAIRGHPSEAVRGSYGGPVTAREIAREAVAAARRREIPSDGRCPACDRHVNTLRMWDLRRAVPLCNGCGRGYQAMLSAPVAHDGSLRAERESYRLSRGALASMCRWSQGYIVALEQADARGATKPAIEKARERMREWREKLVALREKYGDESGLTAKRVVDPLSPRSVSHRAQWAERRERLIEPARAYPYSRASRAADKKTEEL